MIDVVVFDLDGVVVDSEQVWDDVREQLAKERGGRWHDGAQAAMMGMSSPEWSAYMHDEIGLRESPEAINTEVVERMQERYRRTAAADRRRRRGGAAARARVPARRRVVVEPAADRDGPRARGDRGSLRGRRLVGGGRGRQARAGRLPRGDAPPRAEPGRTAAVEDSSNGIRAARAAGMRVLALPNAHFPPPADVLALADAVIASPAELTPALVRG